MTDGLTEVSVAPTEEFRVGRVLGRSLQILFKDFAKFFIVALIPITPAALMALVNGLQTNKVFGVQLVVAVVVSGQLLIGVQLAFIILYALCPAISLYGALQIMRGQRFHLGKALARGLGRRLFPLLGLVLCWLFAVFLGLVLLIVPGLMWIARFYVALPVCVIERLGPLRSMRRSSELTKGYRGRLFGVFLLMVPSSGIGALINVALLRLGLPEAAVWGQAAWLGLFGAFHSVFLAVMYYDLRVLKDGIDIDRVAAVFD